jgi:hypothetical protein
LGELGSCLKVIKWWKPFFASEREAFRVKQTKKMCNPLLFGFIFGMGERVLNNYRKITSILSILEASSYSHKLKNLAPHVARSMLYGLWIEWQKSETNILKYNRIKV